MFIYYKFYDDYFYEELIGNLFEEDNSSNIEKIIFTIIKFTPVEFYQNIKGSVPKWFQFLILDILYEKDCLPRETEPILDNLTLRDYDYFQFINYLLQIEANYVDFFRFLTLLNNNEAFKKTHFIYLEKIVIKTVVKEFSSYEKNLNKESKQKLLETIDMVFKDIRAMKGTKFISTSLSKVNFYNLN
jgi:hypothetical protein